MNYEFKLPDIGEVIHEGTVLKWFVKVGDKVQEFDSLLEVQNDKAVVEIPSPVDGVIKEILIKEDETAIVDQTLVLIETDSISTETGQNERKTNEVKEEVILPKNEL